MIPKLKERSPWSIAANCPHCGGEPTTWESRSSGTSFGEIQVSVDKEIDGNRYKTAHYVFLRCAACGSGGMAEILAPTNPNVAYFIQAFYPLSRELAPLPSKTPMEIMSEFREAELCASVLANRGAAALYRSTLEKILLLNGYSQGSLMQKIKAIADDGVITRQREASAHLSIRVFGNDVLHDAWREVSNEEVAKAAHYTQRLIEDLYDDRDMVENMLREKGKLAPPIQPETPA